MLSNEVLLMLCILFSAILLFLSVYFMITLSDLESDYLNSIQCSTRLNRWTIPRLILLLTHSLLLLFQQSWWMFFFSSLPTLWMVRAKLKVRQGDSGLYDPTEIHVRDNLRRAIMESLGTVRESMKKLRLPFQVTWGIT